MKVRFYFVSFLNAIVVLAATLFLTACLDEIPIVEDVPIVGDFLDDTFGDDDTASTSNITFSVNGGTAKSLTASLSNSVCIDSYFKSFSSLTSIDSLSLGTDIDFTFPGASGTTGTFDVTTTNVSLIVRPSSSSSLSDDTGTITVDSYGDVGGRNTGSFDVVVSNSSSSGTVTGTFSVTRDNDDLDYTTSELLLNSCYN